MAKTLRCNDVIPGCSYVVHAATEEEVMRKAAEHTRLEHNIRRITPEITAMSEYRSKRRQGHFN